MGIIKSLQSVTIHVTVKNAEDTIKKCIDSLLGLDYPKKIIYVTEAYSTDRTYEILKKYGSKITLERVKGNAPTAHNHVLKKLKTEFIAFTDADCVVDKNWLKNLIGKFTSKDIIAVGGFCKTPEGVNYLQRLIGIELENRFLNMPNYVSRLPTMNLCVRSEVARKVPMNESLDVTFETEWGNRLTKFGKMLYVPDAVVYHYHRSTLSDFFKQQMNYGKFVIKSPSIYLKKTKFGDHISRPIMGLQMMAFGAFIISFIATLLSAFLAPIFLFSSAALLLLYIIDMFSFVRNFLDVFSYTFLFFVRNLAWAIGIMLGSFDIFRGKSG